MSGDERTVDVAVIGAGVFGVWTAYHLLKAGRSVALLDAYGPGSSRATSGGETRIIRMSYGAQELYTRWAQRALSLWKGFGEEVGRSFFLPTGVLRLATAEDRHAIDSEVTLRRLGLPHERLDPKDLARRFPQIGLDGIAFGLLEPESGTLLARQSVAAVARRCAELGASVTTDAAPPPEGGGRVKALVTRTGATVRAERFVYACGPWLPRLFPSLLGSLIHVPRAEVLFFGPPPGSGAYAPPALPAWIDNADDTYGVPDIDGRGFKLGIDPPDTPFDPDLGERVVGEESVARARAYLGKRFPGLAKAPVVETRVCQYERTQSHDFLLDRHPDFDNVWLAGGGSGHGFKLGPAVGEYVAERLLDKGAADPRFTLAAHQVPSPTLVR